MCGKKYIVYMIWYSIYMRERESKRKRTDTQESITKSPEFAYKDHANDLG